MKHLATPGNREAIKDYGVRSEGLRKDSGPAQTGRVKSLEAGVRSCQEEQKRINKHNATDISVKQQGAADVTETRVPSSERGRQQEVS